MTIKQVIELFLGGAEEGYTGSKSNPGNLKIKGDKLFHYSTVIAQRDSAKNYYVNLSQYSIQTGNVQKQLKTALEGQDYVSVKRVPRDYEGSLADYESNSCYYLKPELTWSNSKQGGINYERRQFATDNIVA